MLGHQLQRKIRSDCRCAGLQGNGVQLPDEPVSSRLTSEFVSRVTLGCLIASSMHTTCASDLAPTRQANPSQVLQRMHRLFCGFFSSSMTPTGTWKGFKPERAKSSDSC